MSAYTGLSMWHDTSHDDFEPRPALSGAASYDVAIVGGGLTGLWTAYYLRRADPGIRIAVLEAEVAGFGASGRNGGWLSALFPTSWDVLVRAGGVEGAIRQRRAMIDTVDEVLRVCADEGIQAGQHRGGTLTLARSEPQLQRLRAHAMTSLEQGYTDADEWMLDRDEATAMARGEGVIGASFTPHCAAINPTLLVRGLAQRVEASGVDLFEQTTVSSIESGRVETDRGTVTADIVVRATEGYTPRLPGQARAIAPVYSMMVATEPLDEQTWESIGLADRPTFGDGRHLIIYGQRTADGRLAVGGCGAPYHFGSSVKPAHDRDPRVLGRVEAAVLDLFPQIGDVRFTHRWGGPIGIARDWAASVGLDRASGLAWAGGYVGDGLSTTNLAGRTLSDLITGVESDLTTLPWVGHQSRRWEPEPLRWIAISGGRRAMGLADGEEARSGRPSRIARTMAPLLGG